MTIAEFLLARIAEDAALATAAGEHSVGHWTAGDSDANAGRVEDAEGRVVVYDEGSPSAEEAEHIARHDPARVLAECEAKRRIVALHSPTDEQVFGTDTCRTCGCWHDCPTDWPCDTIKAVALPYADHPDYREEWRP